MLFIVECLQRHEQGLGSIPQHGKEGGREGGGAGGNTWKPRSGHWEQVEGADESNKYSLENLKTITDWLFLMSPVA